MPTTVVTPCDALAHCRDSFCPGEVQEPVGGNREEVSFRFTELGGDAPGYERSNVHVRFANEADIPCPHCGQDREITEQKRPRYETSVGNPDYLKQLIEQGRVKQPGEVAEAGDARIAALEAQLAEMRALLEGKANKPGPKPKGDG